MAARPPFMSSPDSSPSPPPSVSPPHNQIVGRDMLDVLLHERTAIEPLRLSVPNLWNLLEAEITRVSAAAPSDTSTAATLSSFTSGLVRSSPIPNALTKRPSAPAAPRKRVKIPVPADKYPEYNFVGRLLGPRGTTLKTLERDTGCKIMIRGKGSIRKDKEPGIRGKPGWEHVFNEALHVVIEVEDSRFDDAAATKALNRAKEAVELLLVPVPEERDGLKRQQLRALAIMNGTYRGGPARSHDQISISSYAASPPVHQSSPYHAVDPSCAPIYLGDSVTSPLSSAVLPGMNHPLDDRVAYRQRQYPAQNPVPFTGDPPKASGRRSPSSGATSPKTYEASLDQLSVLTSNMQHCAVDEFASSSVGDDSPESSPSSEEGEPSTHIVGNGYGTEQVKVSPVSPGPGPDTSLSFGGFIGQEFYNGAFSNGGGLPTPWNSNNTTTQNQVSDQTTTQSFPFSSGPYTFSAPSLQVLTTSTTTVTPIDRHGGY